MSGKDGEVPSGPEVKCLVYSQDSSKAQESTRGRHMYDDTCWRHSKYCVEGEGERGDLRRYCGTHPTLGVVGGR